MILTTLTAAALVIGALAAPVLNESTKAYCTLAWYDDSLKSIQGPFDFSQSGGNVYEDDLSYYAFAFPAAEQVTLRTRQQVRGHSPLREPFTRVLYERGSERPERVLREARAQG